MKILLSENQFKLLINLITEDDTKENVMFVGDSLSSGPGYTWNYLLEKDHPEWNVTHVTKGGMRTGWMLENMLPQLEKKKYNKVFIWGGTNDAFWVGTNLSSAVSNVQKMVDAVKKQGGQTYIFLGYDAESVMTDNRLKPTKHCDTNCMKKGRERMVELQKDLANEITGAIIIPEIEGDDSWAQGDGIHIGPAQHNIIKDHVNKYANKKTGEETTQTKDPNTQEKFVKLLEDFIKIYESGQEIKNGSNSRDIKIMQIILYITTKDTNIEFTGEIDNETKNALTKYQKENNLSETGIFDIKTQDLLVKKIFPGVNLKKTTDNKIEKTSFDVIENPGVSVLAFPSDIEEKFKNIEGVDFNDFKSKTESIGIPVEIALRQLYAESGFNQDVIYCKQKSTAGAQGIAQFMPTTWPSYGTGSPCEVEPALEAYVKLMKHLIGMFPGRLDLAISSYNSGPYGKNGKLYTEALKNNTPFTELKGKIPEESYIYTSRILQPNL
jgi:hypothetical protein